MSEENKAIARRAFEDHFNTGNLDLAREIFAANYVSHDSSLTPAPGLRPPTRPFGCTVRPFPTLGSSWRIRWPKRIR